MTHTDDDIRGSAPIYTAKDVLVSLDAKMTKVDEKLDGMNTSIQIIASQRLDERVTRLESAASEGRGRNAVIKALVGTSLVSSLAAVVALARAFGII